MSKKDYAIGALLGFGVGVFLIPTLYQVGTKQASVLVALPLIFPILMLFGLWLGNFLSRWFAPFIQLAKFAAVGILNTTIDFGVLNLLSLVTEITEGLKLGGVNIPGVAVAVLNSYAWNKYWVFPGGSRSPVGSDLPKFVGVSIIGLLINSGIVVLLTFSIPFGLDKGLWLNVAKVGATVLSFLWNFLGYKFFVFKKSNVAT